MIIGLDISTAITGWAIIDSGKLVDYGHINFKKYKDFWDKVDLVSSELRHICKKYNPDFVAIEEPLQRFEEGKSSAKTISMLLKFNGIVSFIARDIVGRKPTTIPASKARKTCGIKIKRNGVPYKKQALEWVTNKFQIDWPRTRKNNIQQHCYDESDAIVIALAAAIFNDQFS